MPESQNILITLTVDGTEIQGAVALPTSPAPRRVLLPVLAQLTDTIVTLATQRTVAEGAAVSCRKGCDACCRQMVPIAPAEAFALAAHLDALPPAQAATISERFDRAVEALEDKGLLEPLRQRAQLSAAQMQALDRAYFAAQIPCPFLVDRACSIHPLRPLACREYLVSSPAKHCRQPEAGQVRQIPLGAKISRALMKNRADWLPLVLAREYVAQHHEPRIKNPQQSLLGILKKL